MVRKTKRTKKNIEQLPIKSFYFTTEERLKLMNIRLRQDLLQSENERIKMENEKLILEEQLLSQIISKRAKVNMSEFELKDLSTGLCVRRGQNG